MRHLPSPWIRDIGQVVLVAASCAPLESLCLVCSIAPPSKRFLCAEKLRSFSLATVRWFTAGRRIMATNRKARVAEVYQLFISSSIKPTPPGEVMERAQQKVSIVTYKSNNYT